HGVRVGASQRMFSQGSLKQTDAIGDMAVMGEGFFRVLNMDGTLGYTRDGSFKIDANGQFVSSNGYRLMPELILPENFIPESLAVSQQGKVTVKIPGNDIPVDVGQVDLYRFINNAGLQAIGENLYMETPASGDALRGVPGQEGMGKVYHKFLENSNVSVVKEMVGMIVAQRAYELNSKAIQTSDSMLGTANNLKR
ncbi:MAG: flagellar basal-body rod protein FlgG, partial [Spirochaetes bacterium]